MSADTNTFTLFCVVRGEPASNAFEVEIEKNKSISALKELIKAKKAPEFDDVAADKLTLWAVSIHEDDEERLKTLDFKNATTEGLQKLRPTWSISKAFPDAPIPDHIHIIVERPLGIIIMFLQSAFISVVRVYLICFVSSDRIARGPEITRRTG